jgi:uncharacterized protein YkwD
MRYLTVALAVLASAAAADAGPIRNWIAGRRQAPSYQQQNFSSSCAQTPTPGGGMQTTQSTNYSQTTVTPPSAAGAVDALDEVNAVRARQGLRPFLRDPLLTVAAQGAAAFRAVRRMAGHTANDFAFVPPGGYATTGGCGAWPVGTVTTRGTWGTCCTFENHTYAGAAYVIGNDGNRYMHLFVR